MELTGAEICKIIKTCKEANVDRFKLSDLEIDFAPEPTEQGDTHVWYEPKFIDETAEGEETPLKQEIPPGPVDEKPVQDEELDDALLMFEDPAEWERRQLNP